MFGADFLNNTIICFTNFAYNKDAELAREEGDKLTESQLIE